MHIQFIIKLLIILYLIFTNSILFANEIKKPEQLSAAKWSTLQKVLQQTAEAKVTEGLTEIKARPTSLGKDGALLDYFATSVAISEDGLTALIGIPGDDIGDNEDQGSAQVYLYENGDWSVQTQLTAEQYAGAYDGFGQSVALSADGNTALIGAPYTGQQKASAYVYTRNADNTWLLRTRLMAENSVQVEEGFGYSVSLSASGDRALVGARYKDTSTVFGAGSAYLFTNDGTNNWIHLQTLTANDGASNDQFGFSVALSGDGNTVVVGAILGSGDNSVNQGAVYLFKDDGSETFNFITKFTATDGQINDQFGYAVDVTDDGKAVIVGAPESRGGEAGGETGSAYVYAYNGTWFQTEHITIETSDLYNDFFGSSVAFAHYQQSSAAQPVNGLIAIIGAPFDPAFSGQGAAYVYIGNTDNHFIEVSSTLTGVGSSDHLGQSVAMSGDGTTALIGASFATVQNARQGAAYFASSNAGDWSIQERISSTDELIENRFGNAIAASADGLTVVIGAPDENVGDHTRQGAAFVYRYNTMEQEWQLQKRLVADDGAGTDFFGSSVAVSADGSIVLIGSIGSDIGNNSNQGACYVFTYQADNWVQQKLIAIDGSSSAAFGYSTALSADGNIALIGAYTETVNTTFQGAAYIFTNQDSNWQQQTRFFDAEGVNDDRFGSAVALSADGKTALVGIPNNEVNGNLLQGSVISYQYDTNTAQWSLSGQLIEDFGSQNNNFGSAISLSADGTVALIGAPGYNSTAGAAYIFANNEATAWQQIDRFSPSIAVGSYFGQAVSLSESGLVAVIGAYGFNSSTGGAYIYQDEGNGNWSGLSDLIENGDAEGDYFGSAVAISNGLFFYGAPYVINDNSGLAEGAVYVKQELILNNDLITIDEDNSVNIAILDNDFGSGMRLSEISANSLHGSYNCNGTACAYMPAANFRGTDNFDYEACDNQDACDTATVTITVNPINDVPIANAQSIMTDEDSAISFTLDASDVEDIGLDFIITLQPSKGELTNNPFIPQLLYTPTLNTNGADSFTYQVCDGDNACDTATVTITVNPINDDPVANNETMTIDEDPAQAVTINVLVNDTDPDIGDSLTITNVTNGVTAHGSYSCTNANCSYMPTANFHGADSFDYEICDSQNACVTATVTITVNSVNDDPIANADDYAIDNLDGNNVLTGNVLENDSDVDGDNLSAVIGVSVSHGLLEFNTNGSFTYTPTTNYSGTDSFTYYANDGVTDSIETTVTIHVKGEIIFTDGFE